MVDNKTPQNSGIVGRLPKGWKPNKDLPEPINNITNKWCINNVKFHLTYAYKLPKEELVDWIDGLYSLKQFSIAHETYKEKNEDGSDRFHTHVLVWVSKKMTCSDMKRFDFVYEGDNYHPNIRKVITDKHYTNCYKYHSKEDKSPYTNISIQDTSREERHEWLVERILECDTWNEVLLNKDIGMDVKQNINWARELFATKPCDLPDTVITDLGLAPYQKLIIDKIMTKPQPREIIWIWSEESTKGKTSLKNYLPHITTTMDILIEKNCNLNDIFCSYNSENVLTIELPKALSKKLKYSIRPMRDPETDEVLNEWNVFGTECNKLINMIEKLSDRGQMMSLKYGGKKTVCKSHILIFSNCPPEPIEKILPNRVYSIKAELP